MAGLRNIVAWHFSNHNLRYHWLAGNLVEIQQEISLKVSNEKEPWLFSVYRGLYYPVI